MSLDFSRLKVYRYELLAFTIILFAVVLRIILVSYGWPATNSDEGTMGLEAMHIAYQGEHPIFLYGQNYMGLVEAYLGAILFRLFGVSLFSLRLGMILLFALFLTALYCLTCVLYGKKFACIAIALLTLGTRDLLMPEILAVGGVVETLLFGSTLLLLATYLAVTSAPNPLPQKRRWRFISFIGWGFTAGIGLWSHLLIAPFILVGGLILALCCWRELRVGVLLCLLGGFVVGAFPLIYYNFTAPLAQNSLAVFLEIHRANGSSAVFTTPHLFLRQIIGSLLYSIPASTGMVMVCPAEVLPFFGPLNTRLLQCSLLYGGWSLGYIALWTIAAAMELRALWKLWRSYRIRPSSWPSEDRLRGTLHLVRFLLLFSAGITIGLFALSPIAGLEPWSTRYLIGILVALPAVLWPLYHGVSQRNTAFSRKLTALMLIVRRSLLALIGATLLAGTIICFSLIPGADALKRQDNKLVQDLLSLGITRIYSEYWTCDRLIFHSQERIICGVVDMHLKPGLNRYAPYYRIVQADSQVAYLFPADSGFAKSFMQNTLDSGRQYYSLSLDGYVLYMLKSPSTPSPVR